MGERIDVDEVKRRGNLLSLIGGMVELKRVASTGGGEYSGPCPFCGGHDRLRVQPNQTPFPVWMCRHCTSGKWGDGIEFGRRAWPGVSFREICERLAGGDLPTSTSPRPAPEAQPAATPPGAEWQAAARQVLAECQAALWDPKYRKVLDYLVLRGLTEQTVKLFGLGYCATGSPNQYGREIAGLWIPRGIVIPGVAKGSIWYLKIRLMPGVPCTCSECKKVMPGPGECPNCGESNKYRGVKGNRPAAIFNADMLETSDMCLFVEGEFDCMLTHQEIGDQVPVATLGAATNRPDLATWGRFFYGKRAVMLAYDNDQAGDDGAAAIAGLTDAAVLAPLPAGDWKDVTDFYQAGGKLTEWIEPYLAAYESDAVFRLE